MTVKGRHKHMKQNLHPNWFDEAKVTCACGNTFTTGSTVDSIRVEICSKCHPFFTGQQKFVDTLGRVDKFQMAAKKAEEQKIVKAEIAKARAEKSRPSSQGQLSLRDLLMQARKNS
jgi:large subunit ribosomal protein L31